jgi:hypothetical protein
LGAVALQAFTFLAAGFWVVMVSGLALLLVYAVGATLGRRAARAWVNACVALLVVGIGADVAYAVVSGEWEAFLLAYGFGPLLEMGVLGLLFVGSMWFMALRYTQGLER